jgi:signal transduction histidine kinase
MKSLQARLGAGLLLSLVAVFFLLWLLISTSIRFLAEDYISARLKHDSQTLLSALQLNSQGELDLDQDRLDLIYSQPFSGHYFIIHAGSKVFRSRSLWDLSLDTQAPEPGASISLYRTGPQNQPLLILSSGYSRGNQRITISIAEDITAIESDIADFQQRFALVAAVLLLALIIIQSIILRRGLHPLQQIQEEVRLLESGQKERLSEQVPIEVRPLIQEMNRLLGVLAERMQRSRNALGDLAHALKKPLTVLTQIQNDEAMAGCEDIKHTLSSQVSTMQHTTDRILKRARLAGEGPVSTSFDIGREVPVLLETLHRIYRQKDIKVQLDVPAGAELKADREDMLELLGNLLDNAFKWARHQVNLSIKQKPSSIEFIIDDDGPGIPGEALAQLTQRGMRLDEQVAGHGLGLAIVQDIIRLYNGTIQLGKSDSLPGFQVRVTLPGASINSRPN